VSILVIARHDGAAVALSRLLLALGHVPTLTLTPDTQAVAFAEPADEAWYAAAWHELPVIHVHPTYGGAVVR
jgi:hypothetical protein